jgi:hypothetical protein
MGRTGTADDEQRDARQEENPHSAPRAARPVETHFGYRSSDTFYALARRVKSPQISAGRIRVGYRCGRNRC